MEDKQTHSSLRKLAVAAAWGSLGLAIYVTLSRVGLVYHIYRIAAPFLDYPSMRTYASFEHLFAYMVVGGLFCFVYPRSVFRLCLFLFCAIALLEVLQTFTPDRDGTLRDAIEKMVGGATGILLVKLRLVWIRIRHKSLSS